MSGATRARAVFEEESRRFRDPWEIVHNGGAAERMHRMRVPGGWLYRLIMWSSGDGTSISTTFVPDHASAAEQSP